MRRLPTPESTTDLGALLAAAIIADQEQANCIVALRGELGTGKTTLARGFLRALGFTGRVPSPSFTLLEPYDVDDWCIYHLDLYRLTDSEELEFLGLRDLPDQSAICLVEWPERARGFPLRPDLTVGLEFEDSGRIADLDAHSARGRAVLALVAESEN